MRGARVLPYVLILLGLALLFAVLAIRPPNRIGDGDEYYALFFAWSKTLRPWMTQASFAAFEHLFQSHSIIDLSSSEDLAGRFPPLRVHGTADFNHFWFYSFLAFLCSLPPSWIGIALGPQGSYLLLHGVLCALTLMTAYRLFGWQGLVSIVVMTATSAMVWHLDKVHTELLTYCTSLLGVMFVMRERYLAAAFAISVAATQNPSFAIVAALPFCYALLADPERRFPLVDVVLAIGTALVVLLHPVYFFFRYGTPTPQLFTTGAALGANLSSAWIWLFDPDVGLLPNWPIGVVLVLVGIVAANRSLRQGWARRDTVTGLFIVGFLLVNLYANASTTNINSGGTDGVSRYAMWYVPLFFPAILAAMRVFSDRSALCVLGAVALAVAACFTVYLNRPSLPDTFTIPTRLSSYLQRYHATLYDPPFEVFFERYSGNDQLKPKTRFLAAIGPDCRKVLINLRRMGDDVLGGRECGYDRERVAAEVRALPRPPDAGLYAYAELPSDVLDSLSLRVERGVYRPGTSRTAQDLLGTGWSLPEPWGIWTDGPEATIRLPCNRYQPYFDRPEVMLTLDAVGFGARTIAVTNADRTVFSGTVEELAPLNLVGAVDGCRNGPIVFRIAIADPTSPSEVGFSQDRRKLGLGLVSFSLDW